MAAVDATSSQFLQKKAFAIKRNDAEMLTRQDIQFDLLDAIFSDTTAVFTDQAQPENDRKLTFCELYTGALYDSPKCSKVLKEKMRETPAFAIEFAKISLLANIGRINTTMAFFPEMKTALRTYHPVPSLQKTDGNLQDAPRIKNCLKAALLPNEVKRLPPSTLSEVVGKLTAGQVPPTSVVNLIFVMANNTTLLGRAHFEPPVDFLDLFLPVTIPSLARARAFLWLIFHYLEERSRRNPFADEFALNNPGKVPFLPRLPAQEMHHENIDPPEEISLGNKMCARRRNFLRKLINTIETDQQPKDVFKSSEVLELAPRRVRAPRQIYEGDGEEGFRHYAPPNVDPSLRPDPSARISIEEPMMNPDQPYHPPRTMLQHAFHIVTTTHYLADSDEEKDEHLILDRTRRHHVLNWLRGVGQPPAMPDGSLPMDRYKS